MSEDESRATSIGWVRQHVEQRLEGVVGVIGGECGDMEKRLRDYTDQQVTLLVKMIDAQQTKIATLEKRQKSAGRAADRRKT